ncbi:MAG: competence/damage-inducible protein A [Brevefilum sp.]
MPTLEIITIGTELLLGEITDTNSTYIARTLRDHGIDIYRITTIGDNPSRIASTIKEALNRAEIVITTGGLGPTVDDPTRQAIADAADRDLIFVDELWEQILERFEAYGHQPTENNRRQACIPEGAITIPNPVGTAPCFIVEIGDASIISLPGVPREMEFILHQKVIPWLSEKYVLKSQIIKATVLHAASMGESVIDQKIEDLERLSNPTVGLLAHPGQVDIRITAKAGSESEANVLAKPIVEEVLSRLGEAIYGANEETLENIICQQLNQNDFSLCLVESGMDPPLAERIRLGQPDQFHVNRLTKVPKSEMELLETIKEMQGGQPCEIAFGIALDDRENVRVIFAYQDTEQTQTKTRRYGGPQEYAHLWAQNTGLDFLRRQLNQFIGMTQET